MYRLYTDYSGAGIATVNSSDVEALTTSHRPQAFRASDVWRRAHRSTRSVMEDARPGNTHGPLAVEHISWDLEAIAFDCGPVLCGTRDSIRLTTCRGSLERSSGECW